MTAYAIIGRALDLRETPKKYQPLLKKVDEGIMPRVLKIVSFDRQTIALWHLGSNRVYNPITLEEEETE